MTKIASFVARGGGGEPTEVIMDLSIAGDLGAERFQTAPPYRKYRVTVNVWGYPVYRSVSLHRAVLGLESRQGVVHHINERKGDARLANLWVCADIREHKSIWHKPSMPIDEVAKRAREYQRSVGFEQPATSIYSDLDADPVGMALEMGHDVIAWVREQLEIRCAAHPDVPVPMGLRPAALTRLSWQLGRIDTLWKEVAA